MWLRTLLLIFFFKDSCHSEEVTAAPKKENRIMDGQNAEDGQFPWMVALKYEGQFRCGGSIISSTIVLTAAHCIVQGNLIRPAQHFSGIIGSIDKKKGLRIEFRSHVIHQDYPHKNADIAIFKTRKPISFSSAVKPICIASKTHSGSKIVTAMGWGKTNVGDADVLKYGEQTIIPQEICRLNFPNLAERAICTDGRPPSVAGGDSGGPLIDNKLSTPVQIGVTSSGWTVQGSTVASFFASVAAHHDWITSKASVPDICTL